MSWVLWRDDEKRRLEEHLYIRLWAVSMMQIRYYVFAALGREKSLRRHCVALGFPYTGPLLIVVGEEVE